MGCAVKTKWMAAAAVILALAISGCGEKAGVPKPAETEAVTDITGAAVQVPQSVKKLAVVPLPWASVVYALDGDSRRLGAIHPGALSAYRGHFLETMDSHFGEADTRMIGQDFSVNIESAASAGIDAAVLWSYQEKEAEKLKAVGIPAVMINNGTIDELKQSFLVVGKVLGKEERARMINASYDNTYNEITKHKTEVTRAEKPGILFLRNAQLALQGNDNFIHEAIEIGGGANPFAQTANSSGSSQTISMEEVYAIDPDIILLSNFDLFVPADLYDNRIPGQDWSTVKAVKERRVYKVPMGIYRWDAPGVETPLMMQWLARILQPEIFNDLDVRGNTRAFFHDFMKYDLTDADMAEIFADEANAESVQVL